MKSTFTCILLDVYCHTEWSKYCIENIFIVIAILENADFHKIWLYVIRFINSKTSDTKLKNCSSFYITKFIGHTFIIIRINIILSVSLHDVRSIKRRNDDKFWNDILFSKMPFSRILRSKKQFDKLYDLVVWS